MEERDGIDDNFDREPDYWSLENPIMMAGLIIFSSALAAIGFFHCVMPCARIVNGVWPEDWTMATSSRQVHTVGRAPKLRRDANSGSCLESLKRLLGIDEKVHPAALLNNRPVTALDTLKMASGTSAGRLGSAAVRSAKEDTPGSDRIALMSFFVDTSKTDRDWVNASGGGRQGWLDDDLEVAKWQGVGVDMNKDSPNAGRVNKLFLPKNHIAGPMNALASLSNLRKVSLWDNSLTGTLHAFAKMPLLKELDLSNNQLTGTLEPLSGCFDLQDLNVGENQLTGPLHVVGNLRGLNRLVLHKNNFDGTLDGITPCLKLNSLDVSNNPMLWGPLPPHHHQRWVSGGMACNASGTKIGANADGQQLSSSGGRDISSSPSDNRGARFSNRPSTGPGRPSTGTGRPNTGMARPSTGSVRPATAEARTEMATQLFAPLPAGTEAEAVRKATPGQPFSRAERLRKQQEQIARMMERHQEHLRILQENAAAAYAEHDDDGDGQLDHTEIAAYMSKAKPINLRATRLRPASPAPTPQRPGPPPQVRSPMSLISLASGPPSRPMSPAPILQPSQRLRAPPQVRAPMSLGGLASDNNRPVASPMSGARLLAPVQGAGPPRPVPPIDPRSPLANRAPAALKEKPVLGKH